MRALPVAAARNDTTGEAASSHFGCPVRAYSIYNPLFGREPRMTATIANGDNEWIPLGVFPNIHLANPIEGDPFAVVPSTDERVSEWNSGHPHHDLFLRSFTDAFQRPIEPAVLLRRDSVSYGYRLLEAAASFRDITSISITTRCRAMNILHRLTHLPIFSDCLSFYPWALGKEDTFIGTTPALLGVDDIEDFRGQSDPRLGVVHVGQEHLDQPLFNALLERWRAAYSSAATHDDQQLMRSLSVAHRAGQVSGSTDAQVFDFGSQVGLWTSALEILFNSNNDGNKKLVLCRLASLVAGSLRAVPAETAGSLTCSQHWRLLATGSSPLAISSFTATRSMTRMCL